MSRIYLCDVGDVPRGQGRRILLPGGDSLALFHTSSGIRAVKNRCPHAGARLDDGILRKDKLTCIWHGWQFNLTNGKCLNQANARLRLLPLEIEAQKIYLLQRDGDEDHDSSSRY